MDYKEYEQGGCSCSVCKYVDENCYCEMQSEFVKKEKTSGCYDGIEGVYVDKGNGIYNIEYQRALNDIKDKDIMYFEVAGYDSWFNFLTDGYEGNYIKVYEEVVFDIGEIEIEKMWLENHIK